MRFLLIAISLVYLGSVHSTELDTPQSSASGYLPGESVHSTELDTDQNSVCSRSLNTLTATYDFMEASSMVPDNLQNLDGHSSELIATIYSDLSKAIKQSVSGGCFSTSRDFYIKTACMQSIEDLSESFATKAELFERLDTLIDKNAMLIGMLMEYTDNTILRLVKTDILIYCNYANGLTSILKKYEIKEKDKSSIQ